MSNKNERKGLGRGLSALLADVDVSNDMSETGASARTPDTEVPIEKIHANPDQPRKTFAESDLLDLARSIASKGVIQPLIVRPDPVNVGEYQIIAGERRWRASQRAKLHKLPVVIRDLDDTEVLELAIIENIQRADLNAIEEAQGYRQLMDRFGHTQEVMAKALGKSRSHIANLLRLLNLPDEVLEYVRDGRLSSGHARTLISTVEPVTLARVIIDKGLSVRDAEKLVKSGRPKVAKKQLRSAKDADTRAIEGDLSAHLGVKVLIDHKPGNRGGELKIKYSDLEQLDGLCRLLSQ